MAVEITHVRYGGPRKIEQAVTAYRWKSLDDNKTGDSDKLTMVDFLDNQKGKAYVGSGTNRSTVGTVHEAGTQPYLRTYADGVWNNNLLSLPTF